MAALWPAPLSLVPSRGVAGVLTLGSRGWTDRPCGRRVGLGRGAAHPQWPSRPQSSPVGGRAGGDPSAGPVARLCLQTWTNASPAVVAVSSTVPTWPAPSGAPARLASSWTRTAEAAPVSGPCPPEPCVPASLGSAPVAPVPHTRLASPCQGALSPSSELADRPAPATCCGSFLCSETRVSRAGVPSPWAWAEEAGGGGG